MQNNYTIWWENNEARFLDQRKLPAREIIFRARTLRDMVRAIKTLAIRGAPAIGIAALYGVALAAREKKFRSLEEMKEYLGRAIKILAETRPTAVNLFWALEKARAVLEKSPSDSTSQLAEELLALAEKTCREDYETNLAIAEHGIKLFRPGTRVLTHCNAGALATAGHGTALGVIVTAHRKGLVELVYVDETRPLLQGARLTAYELGRAGVPFRLICDSMAGYLMWRGEIDMVITGADRIARNGDTANKIGTYTVAVLARAHNLPFYIAAPLSTFDPKLSDGSEITIEERAETEVTSFYGRPVAPPGVQVRNPAFDITPARYIDGIITEKGIIYPPYRTTIRRILREYQKN